MTSTGSSKVDLVAEATGGKHHSDDPGMDDLEKGWEDFPPGTRVEVRTENDVWRKGIVRESGRVISVECDEKWHDNLKFYEGCGATIMVCMKTRRDILSNIRKIDEQKGEIAVMEEVTCVTCKEEVEVKKIPYGNGHIATCPKCGKLAYNGK